MTDPKCVKCGHSIWLHPEYHYTISVETCTGDDDCECGEFLRDATATWKGVKDADEWLRSTSRPND